MINKRASGVQDLLTIFIFLFIVTLTSGVALFVLNNFNDQWQNNSAVQEIGGDSQPKLQEHTSEMNVLLDGSIVFWFIILWFGSLATSLYLDNTPIWFVIFFISTILSFIILVPFANFQYELSQSALATGGYNNLPMSMFINNNMAIFMVVYIASVAITLYAKKRYME